MRRIFEMSRTGHCYGATADALNRQGVLSPHANCGARSGFSTTVASVLKQRKYLGDWIWNRTKWLNKSQRGKRTSRPRLRTEWVDFHSDKVRTIPDEL